MKIYEIGFAKERFILEVDHLAEIERYRKTLQIIAAEYLLPSTCCQWARLAREVLTKEEKDVKA